MKKRKKALAVCMMAAAMACTSLEASALPVKAAEQQIILAEDKVTLEVGVSHSIQVDYSSIPGGFADLAVAVSDSNQVQAVIQDAGNGKAVLTVASMQIGSGTVAVYQTSNMAMVSYVTVASGYAPKGKVYTTVSGDQLTSVFEDRVVSYKTLANAKNGETFAINTLRILRSKGFDCLEVTGALYDKGENYNGLSTYYANFYDEAGRLISREAVYALQPKVYDQYELKWYIPEGCVRIVVE